MRHRAERRGVSECGGRCRAAVAHYARAGRCVCMRACVCACVRACVRAACVRDSRLQSATPRTGAIPPAQPRHSFAVQAAGEIRSVTARHTALVRVGVEAARIAGRVRRRPVRRRKIEPDQQKRRRSCNSKGRHRRRLRQSKEVTACATTSVARRQRRGKRRTLAPITAATAPPAPAATLTAVGGEQIPALLC